MKYIHNLGQIQREVKRTVITLANLFLLLIPTFVLSVEIPDLTEMSIEDLMDIEITSVSKKPQKLSEAPAAVFVITQEDIRRSGVTSIPEALRMAPGVEVSRIDSNKWAITSRGFNGYRASKLLVLIDGRSVYTPLFSGVFWNIQDTHLEDIEHIEVIRGPGATMWGANAVNGVINIITKNAKDTQGGLLTAGAGNEEKGFGSFRYGAKPGEDTFYRVYAKYFKRDDAVFSSGEKGSDKWDILRAGFRLDQQVSDRNSLTVMGDIYDGETDRVATFPASPLTMQTIEDTTKVSGGNMLSRWDHVFLDGSKTWLQFYYDRTEYEHSSEGEVRNTFDIEFNHNFSVAKRHSIIWGLGYRYTRDRTKTSFSTSFDPVSCHDGLFSAFIQDEIILIDASLRMIAGSKFEYNDYTGFEYQPCVRFLWNPHHLHTVWTAVSRAVRTPARANHDIRINFRVLPGNMVMSLNGDDDYDSEKLTAYEFGYRVSPTEGLSVDIAAFYNSYDDLITYEPGTAFFEASPPPPHLVIPLIMDNKMDGSTYGVEVATKWDIMDKWRLSAGYTFLQIQLHADSSSAATEPEEIEGNSPHNKFQLQSYMSLPYGFEFDQMLYYVDNISNQDVDKYVRVDVRLGWNPSENVEVAVIGQNLFDPQHLEYISSGAGIAPTEVERSVYGKITWKF